MNSEVSNHVQKKYFRQLCHDKTTVIIELHNGSKLTGTIESFDTFTLLVKVSAKVNILVYKNFIVAVNPL